MQSNNDASKRLAELREKAEAGVRARRPAEEPVDPPKFQIRRPAQKAFVQGQNVLIDGCGFHVEKVTPKRVTLKVITNPGTPVVRGHQHGG